MTAASEPVGVSQVLHIPSIETLFKDRYIVSGSGTSKAVALQNDLKI